jgi:hypothetical protein
VSTPAKQSLPKQVQDQALKARLLQDKLSQNNNTHDPELNPKRGSTETPISKTASVMVIGNKPEDIIDEDILKKLELSIGSGMRGNKRRGRLQLYTEIAIEMKKLQSRGITLPRNQSLSKKACEHGLANVLRNHGYTKHSDKGLLRDSAERRRIGNNMSRVFEQVASAVENTPAKIR